MKTRVIDSFIIGGTPAGPSMPGANLQRMLGTRIAINFLTHELTVPTPNGMIIASKGDEILLYENGDLAVKKRSKSNGL